jgi:hypothetical protein
MTKTMLFVAAMSAFVFVPIAVAQDVVGSWKISQQGRNGQTRESTLTIEKSGDAFTGSWESQRGKTEITDAKLDGDTLKFSREVSFRDQSFDIDTEVKVVDGKLMGKNITPRGEREFTGTRVAAKVSFVGEWDILLDFQGREVEAKIIVKEGDDKTLSAMFNSPRGEAEMDNVKIADDTLTFSREMERQGQTFKIEYSAKIVDGKLDGTMETPRGKMKFTGTKVAAKEDDVDPRVTQVFSNFDADSDGKLTEEEAPDRLKQGFAEVDTNGDGKVDKAELNEAMKQFGGQ